MWILVYTGVSSRVYSKHIHSVLGSGSSMTLSRIKWLLFMDEWMHTIKVRSFYGHSQLSNHGKQSTVEGHGLDMNANCFSVMPLLKEPLVNICRDSLSSFHYIITRNSSFCPHFFNKVPWSFLIVQLEHLSAWSSSLGLSHDATGPRDWCIPRSHEGCVIDVFSVLMGAEWLMDQSYVMCSSTQTTVAPPLAS